MERRDFLKLSTLTAAAAATPAQPQTSVAKPNLMMIMADQRRAGLSKATGGRFDTSPTLDRLSAEGVAFDRAYCTAPLIWSGYGIKPSNIGKTAHVSNADLFPTFCEAAVAPIPHGVQGRSLWPLLTGTETNREEFRSAYVGAGVGGVYYDQNDQVPVSIAHDPKREHSWEELNKVTLSGNMKMVRMGDWKLIYDMMGYGQLYHLPTDPCELKNRFNDADVKKEQAALMAELAMWVIRSQDALPTGPQNGHYGTKWPAHHNWYAPERKGIAPLKYIP